jgi:serine/threonine-protein kinase RsbW
MDAVRETQCAVGKEFEIEIALREALANAVVHGCANDPCKAVECVLRCSGSGEVIIVVRDPGSGFDPSAVPNPVAGENVYSTHGRGIYLIRQLMDDVWFECGGSEIHMRTSTATRSHQRREPRQRERADGRG